MCVLQYSRGGVPTIPLVHRQLQALCRKHCRGRCKVSPTLRNDPACASRLACRQQSHVTIYHAMNIYDVTDPDLDTMMNACVPHNTDE